MTYMSRCLYVLGLRCKAENIIIEYDETWGNLYRCCANNGYLFISHTMGISKINLELGVCEAVIGNMFQKCSLAAIGKDIIFTTASQAKIFKIQSLTGEISEFAGSENGCQDGPADTSKFMKSMDVCAKFDQVVYACDAQNNSIKVITQVIDCALFLESIDNLYEAFSVHKKGAKYTVHSLYASVE